MASSSRLRGLAPGGINTALEDGSKRKLEEIDPGMEVLFWNRLRVITHTAKCEFVSS